jgi:hypothetical protein
MQRGKGRAGRFAARLRDKPRSLEHDPIHFDRITL